MKKMLFFIVCCAMLHACSKENPSSTLTKSLDNKGLEIRLGCDSTIVKRVLANDAIAVIVSACYYDGSVVGIDYELDASESTDKYSILNFSGGAITANLVVLSNTVSSIYSTPIIDSIYTWIPPVKDEI